MSIKISKVLRTTEEAVDNYTHMSKWYDFTEGVFEAYFRNLGIDLLEIKNDDEILEIGFGTGSALVKMAQSITTGSVTGIDISPGMVEATWKKVEKHKLVNIIQLINENVLDVELGQYDKIFLSFTLELFELDQIYEVLAKCQKSLRSDGLIVLVSLYKSKCNSIGVSIYEYLHRLFPKEIDCRPIPVDLILHKVGFTLQKSKVMSMWGIPVILLQAKN